MLVNRTPAEVYVDRPLGLRHPLLVLLPEAAARGVVLLVLVLIVDGKPAGAVVELVAAEPVRRHEEKVGRSAPEEREAVRELRAVYSTDKKVVRK